jgi:hypothetical protein
MSHAARYAQIIKKVRIDVTWKNPCFNNVEMVKLSWLNGKKMLM